MVNIGGKVFNEYVDASGDNGFNFSKSGTSVCYAVAILIVDEEDEPYNKIILNEIKKLLGAKQKDEVKYSTLRKHKNSKEAHKLLGSAKGKLLYYVAFKTKLDPKEFDTSVIHSFPINMTPKIFSESNLGNIYIDRMKKPEEDGVEKILSDPKIAILHDENGKPLGDKVKFEDSKRIKLLQLADFYAGAMRYFFEKYYSRYPSLPCVVCKRRKLLCKSVLKKDPLKHYHEIKCFSHLIHREKIGILTNGLMCTGYDNVFHFAFVDCLF